jgi:hypothetical protein
MVGGLLFGGGWMLAALGKFHFAFTVLGIGLMAGIGVGFAYIVPIATCMRLNGQHNRQSQLNRCVGYDQAKPN